MPDLIQTAPCPRWRRSDGPSLAAPQRTACPAAHGAPWNELRITLGLPGCRTDVCLEYPLEMALVGKPEAMRHVGKLAPFARRVACPIDPPIELPGMRRQTSSRTKTTNQAITMAPGQRRQFRQGATPAPSLARYSNTARSITDNENPAASSASPLPRSSRPKNSTSAASLSPGPASAEQAGIEAAEPSIQRQILPRSHRLVIEGGLSAYSWRSRRNQSASRCSIRPLHAWPGTGLQACTRCAGTGDQATKCQSRFVWLAPLKRLPPPSLEPTTTSMGMWSGLYQVAGTAAAGAPVFDERQACIAPELGSAVRILTAHRQRPQRNTFRRCAPAHPSTDAAPRGW